MLRGCCSDVVYDNSCIAISVCLLDFHDCHFWTCQSTLTRRRLHKEWFSGRLRTQLLKFSYPTTCILQVIALSWEPWGKYCMVQRAGLAWDAGSCPHVEADTGHCSTGEQGWESSSGSPWDVSSLSLPSSLMLASFTSWSCSRNLEPPGPQDATRALQSSQMPGSSHLVLKKCLRIFQLINTCTLEVQ